MERHHKQNRWLFGLAAVLVLVLLGVGAWYFLARPPVETPAQQPLRLGAILPLTGDSAFLGEDEQRVLQMLEKELEADGRQVEILYEDSRGTQRDSVNAYRKLRVQGIDKFLLSLTRTAEAVAPIGDADGSLMLALSLHPTITDRSPYLVRFYYGTESQLDRLGTYMSYHGHQSVGVLYVNTPEFAATYTQLLPELAPQLGIEVTATESFDFTGEGIRQGLVKMRDQPPDVILAEDYGFLYPQILENATAYGIADGLLGGIGFTAIPPDQLSRFDGLPFIVPADVLDPSERFQDLISQFEDEYGRPPSAGIDVYYTYNAVRLLAKAWSDQPSASKHNLALVAAWLDAAEEEGFEMEGRAAQFDAVVATYRDGAITSY